LRAQVQELFATPQVQSRLVDFLKAPAFQQVSVQLLAQPEMAQAARTLFLTQPEALPAAASLLSQPSTNAPLSEILVRPEMQSVAQQVAHIWSAQATSADEAVGNLATLLKTAEGRALLNQVLETAPQQVSEWLNRLLSSEQTPTSTEALNRFLALPAVQKALPQFLQEAPPETAARLLTALAERMSTPVAQSILKDPAIQAQIPRLLNQPATADPLLRLLARPDLQEESSRALQPQTPRNSLALSEALTRTLRQVSLDTQDSSASPPVASRMIRATLELLTRPELTPLARQVLANADAQQTIIRQLASPQTAAPVLATLSRPESAPLARLVLGSFWGLPFPRPVLPLLF
jgi:hypothetical protein